MNSSNLYGQRKGGGQQGDVFTLPAVVSFILDEVGYTADRDLSDISIFEPSCGEGEFVLEITSRLYKSSLKYGFDFLLAFEKNVFACDIDEKKMSICIDKIHKEYHIQKSAFKNFFVEDFLLSSHKQVDIIVGNPPYIRYEEIPAQQLSVYKKHFQCFYYRADMYVLFYEKSLLMLNKRGKHCFICSNRWLKNTYGKKLRQMISNSFRLKEIIDLEGVSAFQEEVLAYPSITLITNQQPSDKVSYYKVENLKQLGNKEKTFLNMDNCGSDWMAMFTQNGNSNLYSIEEQGFKIGIGVATGNDSIYVSRDFKGIVEEKLLLPCINAQNLKGNVMKWDGRYLLNPYDETGKLIDLSCFPKAEAYLDSHYEILSQRHKAKKNPKKWYATIDKVNSELVGMPKILLPDISGNKYIFVDEGNFYPQHNIYFIIGGNTRKLKILAALLMSASVRKQLDEITNHMNGGYARWQSQYLKHLRIPMINEIPDNYVNALLKYYEQKNYAGVDEMASVIFDTQAHKPKELRPRTKTRQLSFDFEYA